MKRVAAGAHVATPWRFEPAKRPDDTAEYCLDDCTFLLLCNHQVLGLQLGGMGRGGTVRSVLYTSLDTGDYNKWKYNLDIFAVFIRKGSKKRSVK